MKVKSLNNHHTCKLHLKQGGMPLWVSVMSEAYLSVAYFPKYRLKYIYYHLPVLFLPISSVTSSYTTATEPAEQHDIADQE